jgi:raffinose/stachyose/melibiose transport system substrate-binding protein
MLFSVIRWPVRPEANGAREARPIARRRGARALLGAAALAGTLAFGIGTQAMAASVTLNVLDRATDPKQIDYIKWLVDSFNTQHAGTIHVDLNTIDDNDYHQKVSLVLKGSNPPDVFFSWEGGWAQLMVQSGFAAPLDEYYDKYHWASELNPAAMKLATFSGHQWFVPYYMSASVIWYNTDLFKKYGLTPPTTWAELDHVATVLKSNGVAPFLLANQQQWEAQFDWTAYFVNKYGDAAYQELLTHKIAWTDPRVVDAFTQMKKMADDGWFLTGVNSMDFDTTAIIFWKRQKAAMWYQGSFILAKFLDDKGKLQYPVDWFAYPKVGDADPSISVFAESTWMINKASQHKAEAAELLDYLVSRQAQTRMVRDLGPFPANSGIDESSLPPMVQRLGKVIAQYGGYTWMHVDHALGPEIAEPYLEALQGVLAGTASPEQAATTTEKAAVRTLGPVAN